MRASGPAETPRAPGRMAGGAAARRATVVLLGTCLGAALFALPHIVGTGHGSLGGDYWVVYSAARVVAHGGNPYHALLLTRMEHQVMPGTPPPPANANFAYLPLVALLLVPLSQLPFWASFAVVAATGVGATSLATWALARRLGWRHPALPAIAVALLWPVLWGAVLGQADGWLLLALVAAILLRLDGRGLLAGVLLTATWWKPQILLPATPLLVAGCWPDRRLALRVGTGFAIGTLGGLALQLLLVPGLLPSWWRYLHTFANAIPSRQGDLAGVVGLFANLPSGWRPAATATAAAAMAVAVLGLVALAALAGHLIARRPVGAGAAEGADGSVAAAERVVAALGLPLAVWLLATPYDHVEDLLLLIPLLLVCVGRDGARLDRPGVWAALGAVAALPYLEVFLDGRPNLAPLVVLAVGLAAWPLAAGAGRAHRLGRPRPAGATESP